MKMFDDFEFNEEALAIAILATLALGVLFFNDPVNAGFDRIPLASKIISMFGVLVVSYLITSKMMNN